MLVLLYLAIQGCTTAPKIVYERPVCAPAVLVPLPVVTREELADLPPDVYWRLEQREKLIVDWAEENEAIVLKVCAAP